MFRYATNAIENNVQEHPIPARIELEFSESFQAALVNCQYILENPAVDITSIELGNPSAHLPSYECTDESGAEFESDSYQYQLESITVHATHPTMVSVMFGTDLAGTQSFCVSFPYTDLTTQ
jgi:hypothetical protein